MKTSLLLAALLSAILVVPAHSDITTGLIAWYPFDGNLLDASGNGNHGSPVGGLLATTDRFGTQNGAYEFNGTNSYVFVPNSTSLSSPDTAVTQAAWVLFYGPSQVGQAFGPVLMKSASTANAFMYRMTATPGAGLGVGFNNWFNLYGASYAFPLDQWFHVASVFDVDEVRFYVNGVAIDTVATTGTMNPHPGDLTIGGDIPGILEIFWGKIDDVHIYSRALSDADIAELCGCALVGATDTPALSRAEIRRTYPNPSGGDTHVEFRLMERASVELSVYDVSGRLVRTLRSGEFVEGDHSAAWDGRDREGAMVPSGVYFVRLETNGTAVASRVVRIR